MMENLPTYTSTLIKSNYEQVVTRVHQACQRSGRNPEHVRVVVVSKGQPVAVIQAAIEAGIRVFGENYPEETEPKITAIGDPRLEWHMIGHLQSRKVKIVADQFHWFHALDSVRLAEKLDRVLNERGKRIPVLLECNVGGEESKSGWLATDENNWPLIADDAAAIQQLSSLEIRGLMTMPPLEVDIHQARKYFVLLRRLREFLQMRIPAIAFTELSMGTSYDFEIAVEEGATMVRIGQAILGPRPGR